MDFLKRKPKDLDAAEQDEHDELDESGLIAENDQTQKRQKMLMYGLVGVIAIAGRWTTEPRPRSRPMLS